MEEDKALVLLQLRDVSMTLQRNLVGYAKTRARGSLAGLSYRLSIIGPLTALPTHRMDHLLAAVDLGSNSFRLSIGRVVQQEGGAQSIYQIDRLKETVRLAAGLDQDKRLGEAAVERAVERSEERRGGQECVSTWRSRGSRHHTQKKTKIENAEK